MLEASAILVATLLAAHPSIVLAAAPVISLAFAAYLGLAGTAAPIMPITAAEHQSEALTVTTPTSSGRTLGTLRTFWVIRPPPLRPLGTSRRNSAPRHAF